MLSENVHVHEEMPISDWISKISTDGLPLFEGKNVSNNSSISVDRKKLHFLISRLWNNKPTKEYSESGKITSELAHNLPFVADIFTKQRSEISETDMDQLLSATAKIIGRGVPKDIDLAKRSDSWVNAYRGAFKEISDFRKNVATKLMPKELNKVIKNMLSEGDLKTSNREIVLGNVLALAKESNQVLDEDVSLLILKYASTNSEIIMRHNPSRLRSLKKSLQGVTPLFYRSEVVTAEAEKIM